MNACDCGGNMLHGVEDGYFDDSRNQMVTDDLKGSLYYQAIKGFRKTKLTTA